VDVQSGEAGEVLARLERIEALREAWARAEGDARAQAAASKLRKEAEGMR
jgi:hypothetical protein